MRKILFTILTICFAYAANAQNYTLYADIQYDTISGVDPKLLSLDIYKPNGISGLVPVVIYVHGGSWRTGDKDNVMLKPEFFCGLGYVFISINYRLSPNPPDTTASNAVRFPVHPQNVAKAIAWIYNNIHNYGGDKNKLGLSGHSAGGHIAAVVAANHSFLDANAVPNQIPCVCMYDAAAYNVVRLISFQNSYAYSIQSAMGNDPGLWDDASPAIQIRNHPGLGRWILFSQAQGTTLYDEAALMQDSLAANGYIVPHYPLALEHDEMNAYVGIQDSLHFQQLLIDYPFFTPSPNAMAIAIAYTDSVQIFFQHCFNSIVTGINETSSNNEFQIYPNPSSNSLFIIHPRQTANNNSLQYQIINIFGQIMQHGKLNGNSMDVSWLKGGIYIIQLMDEKGFFFTSKFIKE